MISSDIMLLTRDTMEMKKAKATKIKNKSCMLIIESRTNCEASGQT